MDKNNQEQYMKFHMLNQQAAKTQKQVQMLEEQKMELSIIKEGLKDLKATKTETEILVPVSSGIFAKAKLSDNTKLIVNVGNNVTVEKTIDETSKLIENQAMEIHKVQHQLIDDLTKMEIQLKTLETSFK